MAATSDLSPDDNKNVSEQFPNDSGCPQSGLRGLEGDAKGFEGLKYSQLNNEQLQEIVKKKIGTILSELAGFSYWQANHILECVSDVLNEKKESQLSNLVVLP